MKNNKIGKECALVVVLIYINTFIPFKSDYSISYISDHPATPYKEY